MWRWYVRSPLYNPALVVVEPLAAEDEVPERELVYRHLENTEGTRAREILGAWPTYQSEVGHEVKRLPLFDFSQGHGDAVKASSWTSLHLLIKLEGRFLPRKQRGSA
jgi:hypothetical protein